MIPNETLKYSFMILMVLNRLTCGMHFLTDCCVGLSIGWLSTVCAQYVTNSMIALIILLFTMTKWHNCGRIIGGCFPILLLQKRIICNPIFVVLAFVKIPLVYASEKLVKPKDGYGSLIRELLASTIATLTVAKAAEYLNQYAPDISEYVKWNKI